VNSQEGLGSQSFSLATKINTQTEQNYQAPSPGEEEDVLILCLNLLAPKFSFKF
jgi:hypothetical protein